MMNNYKNNFENDIIHNVIYIIVLIVVSNILSFLLFLIFNIINPIKENNVIYTFILIITLFISFGFIPYKITNRLYPLNLQEIGIKKLNYIDCIIFIFAVLILIAFYFYQKKDIRIILITIQQMGVSIFEEFFTRGLIIFILSKIIKQKWLIIILSGIIFGFLFHSASDILTNLLIRFPVGIILGYIYIKTKRLYPTIIIHLLYNTFILYIL